MSSSPSETAVRLARHVVSFGRVLRRIGFAAGSEQVADALRAVELVGVRSRRDVYAALYSVFVTRREQAELFNQAFHLFWRKPAELPEIMRLLLPELKTAPTPDRKQARRVQQAIAEERQAESRRPRPQPERPEEELDLLLTYSPVEVLRQKDFAEFSEEEMQAAKRFLQEWAWPLTPRRIRRRVPDPRGRLLHLRRTVRSSLRQHGEFMRLQWQGRATRPRGMVILCDISGSMERYSRMLLHFMHVVTSGLRRVETFVFGTRLTRITRYLRQRDVDEAVDAVSKVVNDWAGGTRIGEALKDFNYNWARRVLRSGSVVLVISDGWDRGDIPLLEREMARLSRSCYRLIWLNPLLGYSDYRPLTKGIRAALPYIDEFLPVHNLESLEQLGARLNELSGRAGTF